MNEVTSLKHHQEGVRFEALPGEDDVVLELKKSNLKYLPAWMNRAKDDMDAAHIIASHQEKAGAFSRTAFEASKAMPAYNQVIFYGSEICAVGGLRDVRLKNAFSGEPRRTHEFDA